MECAATHGSHAAYMALCSLYNIFFFGVRGITRSIYEFYEEIVALSNHLERMFPHTKKMRELNENGEIYRKQEV